MMYGWGNNGWDAGMWIIMIIVVVMLWVLIVFGVMAFSRYLRHGDLRPLRGNGGAEAILRDRFARGEIDEDEFRKRMTALREHR